MLALMCLGEYSRANDSIKRLITLYLFSTGAQRQVINVLSNMGLAASYSSLISTRLRKHRRTKKRTTPDTESTSNTGANSSNVTSTALIRAPSLALVPASSYAPLSNVAADEGKRLGTLYQLSDSVREEARRVAATGLYGVVYDNINMNFAVAEQIIGRHGE